MLPASNKILIKGTFFYAIRQVLVTIIQLISSILVLKWIDPTSYGNYSIIALVLGLSQLIADGGFGVYLIQQQREIIKEDLSEIVSFQFLIYLIIHIILLFVYFYLDYSGFSSKIFLYILLTFFVIPLTILRASNYVWLEKKLEFDKIAIVEILETLIYSIFTLILVYKGCGVWSFVIAALLKAILGYLLIRRYKTWEYNFIYPKFNDKIKKAIQFGISYHTPTLINYLRVAANPIIIGPILGMAAVGIADRAIFFAGLPLYFIGAVQQKVLFPYFSTIQTSNEKVKSNFEFIYYFSSVLDKIFYIPLIILTPLIIKQFFPIWKDAIPLFYVAIVGCILFGSLSFSTFPVLNGLGKTKVVAITSVISVLVTWILIYPLIYYFGIIGYSILGLLIWIIGLVPGIYLIKKHIYNVKLFKQFSNPLFAFSLSMCVAFFVIKITAISLLFYILISIFCILFYLLILHFIDNKILKELYIKVVYPLLKK
jgi:O-antigen/teichoic acid export membrane protein